MLETRENFQHDCSFYSILSLCGANPSVPWLWLHRFWQEAHKRISWNIEHLLNIKGKNIRERERAGAFILQTQTLIPTTLCQICWMVKPKIFCAAAWRWQRTIAFSYKRCKTRYSTRAVQRQCKEVVFLKSLFFAVLASIWSWEGSDGGCAL